MLWDRKFSHVVQQSSGTQRLHFRRRESQVFGYFHGVDAYAPEMIVGGMVLGFDGQCQCFNGAQVQSSHFFDVLLFVVQPAEISAVRAVNKVNDRNQNQGSVPVSLPAQHRQNPGDRSAAQIIRKAPKVAVVPDFRDRLSLGHRNCCGHRHRVHQEKDASSNSQPNRIGIAGHAG